MSSWGILLPMRLFLDSFWRAVAYCLMPRVIVLSLLPLAMLLTVTVSWAYFYWEPTQVLVRDMLLMANVAKHDRLVA